MTCAQRTGILQHPHARSFQLGQVGSANRGSVIQIPPRRS